jgi:hypothetical protein
MYTALGDATANRLAVCSVGHDREEMHNAVEPTQGQRRTRVVKPIVEPRFVHVVPGGVAAVLVPNQARHLVGTQAPHAGGDLSVVGGHHPALADREVLIREDAECGDVTDRADVAVADPRPTPSLRAYRGSSGVTRCRR